MKIRVRVFIAIVAAFTAIHSVEAQPGEQRLAKLVEANVIAVHAFQVLLAKSSGKGRQCFSASTVSDSELNALSEHQAKLLKTDIKQLRLWVNGLESDRAFANTQAECGRNPHSGAAEPVPDTGPKRIRQAA